MKKFILAGIYIMISMFVYAQSSDYDKKTKAMASVATESAKNEKIIDLSGRANLMSELKQLTVGGYFVDKNIKFKTPISGLNFHGSTATADPSTTNVTLEVMNFGTDGNTVLFTINSTSGEKTISTLSWSGEDVHVVPHLENGTEIIAVTKGEKPVAALLKASGSWYGVIQDSEGGVKELYRGMTRAEVETLTQQLGLSKFKLSNKTSLYEVYSLYWLDMQKQYNIFGDYKYNMRNDKKYGDFYFNSTGKLIKWLIY